MGIRYGSPFSTRWPLPTTRYVSRPAPYVLQRVELVSVLLTTHYLLLTTYYLLLKPYVLQRVELVSMLAHGQVVSSKQ